MINANLTELLGLRQHYLNDEGTLAVIDTPFVFEDMDSLPVYIEEAGQKIRFFDDGEVVWHFKGIGVHLNGWDSWNFIGDLARPHGVSFNERLELEVWAEPGQAPAAFARYLSALLQMVCWEREYNAELARRRQEYLAIGKATLTS